MIQITLRHGASPSEERIQRPERPQRANRPPDSVSPLQSFIVRTNTILQNVGRREELPRPSAPVQDDSYNRSISPIFANQSTIVSSDSTTNRNIHDMSNSVQHPCQLYSASTSRPQIIDLEFSDVQQSIPTSSDINCFLLSPPFNNTSTAATSSSSPVNLIHQQQTSLPNSSTSSSLSTSTTTAPAANESNDVNIRSLLLGLLGEDSPLTMDRTSRRTERSLQRPSRRWSSRDSYERVSRRMDRDNEDDEEPFSDRSRERTNFRPAASDRSRSPLQIPVYPDSPRISILPRRYLHRRFPPPPEPNTNQEPEVPVPPLINLVEGEEDQENSLSNNNQGNPVANPVPSSDWYPPSVMMMNGINNNVTVERIVTVEGNGGTVPENSNNINVIDENLDEEDVELDEDVDEDIGGSGDVAQQEIVLSDDLEEDNEVLMSVSAEDRVQEQSSAPAQSNTANNNNNNNININNNNNNNNNNHNNSNINTNNNSNSNNNNNCNNTSSVCGSSSSTQSAVSNRMDVRLLVLSALECPVCFDYVSPPVTQCTEGHLVCNRCLKRLNDCPECRGKFSNVRPRAVEKIASLLEYPCSYEGCTEFMAPAYRSLHAKTCSFRSFLCPISPENCSWSGVKSALHNHIVNFHGRHLHWIDGQKLTFIIRSQVGNERVYVMEAINNLFLVKFIVAPQDKLRGCVTLLGCDTSRAESINVAVLVHSSDRPSPSLMVNRTPAEENDEMDMRLEKFAVFDISQFTQNNSTSSLIRVRIAIGKKDILKQVNNIFE